MFTKKLEIGPKSRRRIDQLIGTDQVAKLFKCDWLQTKQINERSGSYN